MTMHNLLGLKSKTAMVWGGGAGMGEATARRLAEAGCNVAVIDKEADLAKCVADVLCQRGCKAIALAADATVTSDVDAAVAATEAQLGPVDVMATVIGIGVWSTLVEMTEAQWLDAHRLNLTSFFLPARAVARAMIRDKRPGAIVSVASVSGLTSAPNHGGYGAAKAGLINLVRTMAVEWGPHAIRVNAIAPGAIATPRIQMSEAALATMKQRFPLGRPGTPDEIAKTALFLLSDQASYITGHTLPVDGGWMSTFLMNASGPAQ